MNFSQFSKKLNNIVSGMDIQECIHFYDTVIKRTTDNIILIDDKVTGFNSLSEAKQFIRNKVDVQFNLCEDFYKTNTIKIADVIKENHNIKVTNQIIEKYINIASDRTFTIDPVIHQIREMNKFDTIIDNKIHYILEDNSTIAIDRETQEKLNTILKQDVIEFMKESSSNFLKILNVILKDN